MTTHPLLPPFVRSSPKVSGPFFVQMAGTMRPKEKGQFTNQPFSYL
jgi:hypothetical protein